MRSKSVILLVLALGCGVVAAVGIGQVMEGYRTKEATPGDFEKIFVALTDININEPITAQNVSLEEWPKGKVPAEAITKFEDIAGKKLKYRLTKGEPILANKLAGSQTAGVTGEIPDGYRLGAVRVDAVSTGGSLLAPGDRVDVLVNLPAGAVKGGSGAMTTTILKNIAVFAVDTITVNQQEKEAPAPVTAKTVSLIVTPAQAVKLSLAESLSGATIRLVLRPRDRDGVEDNDPSDIGTTSASISDITGIPEPDKVAEEAKAKDAKSAAQAADLPPVPSNFSSGNHMTIIEGDRIREVRLDDNGRAIIPIDTGAPDDIPSDEPPSPVSPSGT